MGKWWRRIRSAIGMGLVWAVAGFGAGVLLARVYDGDGGVPFAILFAPLGFLTGIVFSGILVATEGRRSFDRMSLPRFAGWGALSGLLLSGIFAAGAALLGDPWRDFLVIGPALAAASAVCAVGTLAVARRAERQALRPASRDPAGAELGEVEEPERLGRGD
jgi:hypothetical protein